MARIPLFSRSGEARGEVEASDEVFGAPDSGHLVHTAVVAYLANQRRGQSRAKTRGEVRGGGRKPWRQKGTGRARAGSINSPLWRHGGVAHGPKERDYSVRVPKKMLRKALRAVLSHMLREGRLIAIEDVGFEKPASREASGILKSLKLSGSVLLLVHRPDENLVKSFRNIEGVRFQDPESLNVYDAASSESIVAFRDSLPLLEKRLAVSGNGETAEG